MTSSTRGSVIGRAYIIAKPIPRQPNTLHYWTPRGWSRNEADAYHYDMHTAARIANKMRSRFHFPAFAVYATSNFNSNIRRVGC